MRITTTLFACTASLLLSAQGKESTVKTDTGTVVLHWFTSGQLSSKAWMDADNRWGHSWVYDRSGQVIFDQQTRKVGGYASVDFRYHANGAVSRAEYSNAPDGGIQWYGSTTTFDPDSKQTGFSEEGWDNEGPIRPHVSPPPAPAPPSYKQEEVREQHMYTNEYFVVRARTAACNYGPSRSARQPRTWMPHC